jgi:polyribonucleotide 5'-hydroxyl-kinase
VDAFKSWLSELCTILSSDVLRYAVNVILVVGHEKLNVEMQRAYSSYVTVVKIPKSGGVSQFL